MAFRIGQREGEETSGIDSEALAWPGSPRSEGKHGDEPKPDIHSSGPTVPQETGVGIRRSCRRNAELRAGQGKTPSGLASTRNTGRGEPSAALGANPGPRGLVHGGAQGFSDSPTSLEKVNYSVH